ncbi:MAG: DUF192 domain-containing protein [Cyanobacteria bacterium P01_F01_bin.53]
MRLSLWTRSSVSSALTRVIRGVMLSAVISTVAGTVLTSCSFPDGPAPPHASDDGSIVIGQEEGLAEAAESAEALITLNGPGQLLPVSATAEMKDLVFELEVARTREEQSLGLMFRSALPDNRGMLFPFDQARRASFWMKDVPVALDMVFIRNGEVIAIAPSVPPCPELPCPAYGPGNELVDMVLELRSGRAAEINLQAGDAVVVSELP